MLKKPPSWRFFQLPLLDTFRTVDWKRIKEELEELKLSLGIQLASVGI